MLTQMKEALDTADGDCVKFIFFNFIIRNRTNKISDFFNVHWFMTRDDPDVNDLHGFLAHLGNA